MISSKVGFPRIIHKEYQILLNQDQFLFWSRVSDPIMILYSEQIPSDYSEVLTQEKLSALSSPLRFSDIIAKDNTRVI